MAEHDLAALDAAAQKRRLDDDGATAVLDAASSSNSGPLFAPRSIGCRRSTTCS